MTYLIKQENMTVINITMRMLTMPTHSLPLVLNSL